MFKKLKRTGPIVRAIATGDPELDPLVSFLKDRFAKQFGVGQRLVVCESTGVPRFACKDDREFLEFLMKSASESVPAGVIRDFCEKNRQPSPIWPDLTRHLPATVLTSDESKALFSGGADEGWRNFHKAYPQTCFLVHVSRVGLSPEGPLAIFYTDELRGPLYGRGGFRVLKKEGYEWIEVSHSVGVSWVS